MPDPGLDARFQYLDRSARFLQSAAPSTSAHLMHERNAVAEEQGKSLNRTQLEDVCKVCGAILVRGVTLKTEMMEAKVRKGKRKRKTGPASLEPPAKHTRSECLCCRRVTMSLLQESQQREPANALRGAVPAKHSQPAVAGSELLMTSTKAELIKPESANAGSKKRAKARKQGGLQALLEKSRGLESRSAAPGFDLMDFMKKK